jgi:HAD superfamily hydrolase (TIGR01509 family)
MERDELLVQLLLTEPIVMPFVEESLIDLKKHFHLHIVTSSSRNHFLTMHKRTGYLKYFTNITTEEDFKNRKPAPDAYLKSMQDIGAKPNECIVFEDSERGLNAAVNAGLKCVAIPNELTKRQNFSSAWKMTDNFKTATNFVIEYEKQNKTL